MKILMVAAEHAPYATLGGLSQAISFLSAAETKQGIDTRVFIPKYGVIDEKKYSMKMDTEGLCVPTGHSKSSKHPSELICNVKFKESDFAPIYFLENREYFELRANVYGYGDEHIRFALLSLGCLEWLLSQKAKDGWLPDLIHANDWHTGFLIEAIKNNPRYKKAFSKIKILFTIHNLKHQGNNNFRQTDKPDTGKSAILPMFDVNMRLQNPMLRGILYADWVNTVSRKHAQEIQTKEYGEGLEKALKKVAYKLSGIANGINVKEMNPETDKHITSNYNAKKLDNRRLNKAALQKYFKLPVADDVPVYAYIGRLASQKGIDLILKMLENIESLPKSQFIFLGTGSENYYDAIKSLVLSHPTRVAAHLKGDFLIPRKIFAGADFLLMPSLFEPGGIAAMEALRYGCVPIVSDTGGLSETVQNFSVSTRQGNGFLHEPRNFWSFFIAVIQAMQVYQDKDIWKQLVKNGMVSDFSWDKTASRYQELYKQILKV